MAKVSLAASLLLPASHEVHSRAPDEVEYFPTPQGVQAPELMMAKVPGVHLVQEADPKPETRPGKHEAHSRAPDEGEYFPIPQRSHNLVVRFQK